MSASSETPSTPAPLVAPRRRSGGGNLALVLAVVVAAAGVAFAAGRVTAPASAASPQGFAGQGPGSSFSPNASGAPGGILGGGSTSLEGTVSAISGTTLTIQTSAGRTVTVDLTGATYHAQATATATATAADVVTGATVRLQVTGMGGPGGPAASPATGAAASGGTATVSATDVTILAK
jgi:hypothetical protein